MDMERPGRLIAADSAGVYLLTDDRTVLGLSPATGHLSRGRLRLVGAERGLAARPRLPDRRQLPRAGADHQRARPRAEDQQYFYGPRPVALVELYTPTKLPVWPGKFAACRPVR